MGILVDKKAMINIYQRIARKHGLNLLCFTPQDILEREIKINGLLINRFGCRRKKIAVPPIIYNRIYPENHQIITKLIQLNPKIKIFNRITQFDKWKIYQHLHDSSVTEHLPPTHQYESNLLAKLIKEYHQIIIKPCKGHQGVGLWRIKELSEQRYQITHQFPFPLVLPANQGVIDLINLLIDSPNNIIQAYIDLATINQAHFDLRALVQKNKLGNWEITAITSRIAKYGHYITNICDHIVDAKTLLQQSKFDPNTIVDNTIDLSLATAKELDKSIDHLGEISVDLGLDTQGKLWIIEVNGKPNKHLYTDLSPSLTEKTYLTPLQYGNYLAQLQEKRL